MKIVDIIWRKPVSTYAMSACEALVASVNFISVELSFPGTFAPVERKVKELSLHGTFVPVELLLLRSE